MKQSRQDKLTAKDLLTLLGNSPELTPVQAREADPILYFIKELGTAKMMVLPPSTDNKDCVSNDVPSFEAVVKDFLDLRTIDKTDCLIFPLLQQHAYKFSIVSKPNRNQWVTFVVRFDQKESKWVGTLIDPSGKNQTQQYQGNQSLTEVFSKVFSPAMMVTMNLNVANPRSHSIQKSKTYASGHWAMHCIQLLLKGTELAELIEIMRSKKAKNIIPNNQKLLETSCQRSWDIGSLDPSSNTLKINKLQGSLSSFDTQEFLEGELSRSNSRDSLLSNETFTKTESQFIIVTNNRQNSENRSASLCLNCYALLFMGGTVVAAIGIICLFSIPLAVLPIVSTGLIGAGAFGMFAGTVGMCARQSPFYQDATLVNAPN